MTSPQKSNASIERPRLLVVAGPNGSGKTSVTEQGLRHEWFSGCLYINPDNLARERFGDWNDPKAILQAAQLAQSMREEAIAAHASIAFETVLSTEGKIDFIRRAKNAGYFVRLFFVGTESPAINAARSRSMANSILAARIVDRAYFYDNTPENQPARLLFRCHDGRLEKSYGSLPKWAGAIQKALK